MTLGFSAVLLQALMLQPPLRAANTSTNSAEDFVLQSVTEGEWCDLNACNSADKPRIRASFLANLLTHWPEVCPTNKELPRAVSIANATICGNIDLANLEVPFEVELTNCIFEGEVNFSKTVFRRSLHLSGSKFGVRTAFNAMVIGRSDWSGSLYIDSATFNAHFDLTDASIERNLFAGSAQFLSAEHQPRFSKLNVHGDAHFDGAVFTSAPIFTQAEFKHGFLASRAHFNDSENPARFDDLIVGDDASFTNCIFLGPVDFNDARIQGDLQACGAKFQNDRAGANFKSLRVDGSLFLSQAVFSGPVDFTRAAIGAGLELTNARFTLPSAIVLFHEMKVEGDAVFDGTIFDGPVNFHATRITDELSLQATQFRGLPDSAFLDHMSVSGPARLAHADFVGQVSFEVSFEHSTFSTLDLENVIWPETLPKPWLRLDGLKYERISNGDDAHSWRRLVRMLSYASFNANAYGDLESFYQRSGHPEFADQIFFAQKHRERTDTDLHASFGTKAWSHFLNVFVRYGRAPWMAFLWGLIIVLLGTVAFNDKRMEAQLKDESKSHVKTHHQAKEAQGHQMDAHGHAAAQSMGKHGEQDQQTASAQEAQTAQHPLPGYNPFWYSLDLFAPVIDLEAATAWRPKKLKHPALYHYSRLHRILGWILVPIGAAAISGFVK
jgi:uncharacterized protein YjbI with pentapeptide repeats